MGRPMTANGHHEELRCEVVAMDQELHAHDAYERRALEAAARDVAIAQEYIEEWRWSAGGSASATRAWNRLENALQTIRDLQRRDVRENALHRGFAPTAAALAGIAELAAAGVA
ncbi:MAG: hypothetical protein IPG47_17570 [Thermoflexaceae bacterium]|nr:hypothetical protein [Thermoflexaceae bacterium]